MNVVLISPIFPDLGISTLAPLLKRDGHDVRLLFLPQFFEGISYKLRRYETEKVLDFIKGAEIVGVNSFSENHSQMVNLVDSIKKSLDVTVVWGGIHATLRPEECIDHADFVCIGEGEKAMSELAKRLEGGRSAGDVKNLISRDRHPVKKNPELYPLINLDELLSLDYDLNSQYLFRDGMIRNVAEPDYGGSFIAFSARGCPFRCSYCCSGVIHDMYKTEKVCRQRSIDNVLSDLRKIKSSFPSCSHIWFNEADFIVGKTQKDIEYFAVKYKDDIGVPFSIWSNPASITDGIAGALKGAGLTGMNIGTVNGSARVQESVYKRHASASLYLEKAATLKRHDIGTEYDFILCNPYEKEEDIVETIRLLLRLPKPFKTVIYTLTYFPGTELYDAALRDGKIKEKGVVHGYTKAAYGVWKFGSDTAYINVVASLMRGRARKTKVLKMTFYGILPEAVLKILISKQAILLNKNMPFKGIIYRAIGNMIAIMYTGTQKFSSFKRTLRRWRTSSAAKTI